MEKSMITSMLNNTCPKCREGKLFAYKTYDLKNFQKMNPECECCKQPFQLEPGFYDGAMYVSYALQVALFVSVFVAYQVLYPEADIWWYLLTVSVLIVLLIPVFLRLSRSVWIHFFIRYRPNEQKST